MPYQYHIFFSYKRDALTLDWHREVVKRLKLYVCNSLDIPKTELSVFFDENSINEGDYWAENISEAIKTSKCLVAIWSPEYFHSEWCLSEFHSFLERQEITKKQGLIIPASYHDGVNFPIEAKKIQFADFTNYASTIETFWKSIDAVEFDKKLRLFGEKIAEKIRLAPEFKDDYPFINIKTNNNNNPSIGRFLN